MQKCIKYQTVRPKDEKNKTIADELFDSDDEHDEDDEEVSKENRKPKKIQWNTVWRIISYNKGS